ncbi:MAG: hypothetical protein ACR5KV_03130 [Wolbachia sp.]
MIHYTIFSISSLFIILPIIIILFATFNKHKQFLNDKIARTVVIGYKHLVRVKPLQLSPLIIYDETEAILFNFPICTD